MELWLDSLTRTRMVWLTHVGKHLLNHFLQMIEKLDIVSLQIVTVFSQEIERFF